MDQGTLPSPATAPTPPAPTRSRVTEAELVEAFLSGRKATTLETYRRSLEDFRRFVGASSVEDCARGLFEGTHGDANAVALRYRSDMIRRGLAPATVNLRLAALRSFTQLARMLGLITWTLEVRSVPSRSYRDTTGPGLEGFKCMVDACTDARDRAILRLMFDLGLRRGEVAALDIADVNLAASEIRIVGKGRYDDEIRGLPSPTREALRAWIAERGEEPGPLFLSRDRASRGNRLTTKSIYEIVRKYGDSSGVGAVRPHGLRHAAITTALEATGGDVAKVARFSRHRDVRTVMTYWDNHKDVGGEISRLVASGAV